jgi:7-keto-8-aminopelargonate synthetase-like enzyme
MENYNLFLQELPNKFIKFENQSYRWLGGSNYLCIGAHPLFQQQLKTGILKFPQNWGSSRANNIKFTLWDDLEIHFAEIYNHEQAALCTSGQLAGQTCLQVLGQLVPEFEVEVAPQTHPCLWPQKYYPTHLTYNEWIQSIKGIKNTILVCDGIQTPFIEQRDLSWIKELDASNVLIVDESHRIGLLDIHLETPASLIQIASLSKTYGIPAGIILGDHSMIEAIKKHSFWIGASPPSPSHCYAALNSRQAYLEQKEKLSELIKQFQKYTWKDIQVVNGHPSFASKKSNLFQLFKEKGFLLNHFPYPNPVDSPITRGIIHPLLHSKDLEEIIEIMNYEL